MTELTSMTVSSRQYVSSTRDNYGALMPFDKLCKSNIVHIYKLNKKAIRTSLGVHFRVNVTSQILSVNF